jgi:hypothetical protein
VKHAGAREKEQSSFDHLRARSEKTIDIPRAP